MSLHLIYRHRHPRHHRPDDCMRITDVGDIKLNRYAIDIQAIGAPNFGDGLWGKKEFGQAQTWACPYLLAPTHSDWC